MDSAIKNLAAKIEGRNLLLALPEGTDARVLAAARILGDRHLAGIILPGIPADISAVAKAAGIDVADMSLVNPADNVELDAYARQYLELRPGAKMAVARRVVSKPLFFAGSMLKAGHCHAMLAGVANTTARVVEACLMTVGKAGGIETPSSSFLMLLPDRRGGRPLIFADCAVNVEPGVEQLADIALASADTARFILGEAPRIAFLSFSTRGSGNHALARKMAEATSLAAARAPDLTIDGELQADTALVERVARIKLEPPGDVAGKANVLIFPDLNSGNIAYKLVQHLGGARAIGPLLQGFAGPVADLSRGASVEDIVDTAIVTLARVASVDTDSRA